MSTFAWMPRSSYLPHNLFPHLKHWCCWRSPSSICCSSTCSLSCHISHAWTIPAHKIPWLQRMHNTAARVVEHYTISREHAISQCEHYLHFEAFTVNIQENLLTFKVLNFWKFTSYCSLKPLWSGMEEVVPARTSPTLHPPSPPTVHQLSRLAL